MLLGRDRFNFTNFNKIDTILIIYVRILLRFIVLVNLLWLEPIIEYCASLNQHSLFNRYYSINMQHMEKHEYEYLNNLNAFCKVDGDMYPSRSFTKLNIYWDFFIILQRILFIGIKVRCNYQLWKCRIVDVYLGAKTNEHLHNAITKFHLTRFSHLARMHFA